MGGMSERSLVLVVLLLVLLVLLALTVSSGGLRALLRKHATGELSLDDPVGSPVGGFANRTSSKPGTKTGGGESTQTVEGHPHLLSEAIRKARLTTVENSIRTGEFPASAPGPKIYHSGASADKIGGKEPPNRTKKAKVPKKETQAEELPVVRKHWTECDTWEEVTNNGHLRAQYWADRQEFLANLSDNWDDVRKEAKPLLEDGQEWVGLINIVDGKPKIVAKLPSGVKVKDVSHHVINAYVPAEVVNKLINKPAMIFFHTHVNEGSPIISPTDACRVAHTGWLGHYAGEMMICDRTISLYGLTEKAMHTLWDDPHSAFVASRLSYDIYTAMHGMRSMPDGSYTIKDIENVLEHRGVYYYNFPTDKFAPIRYTMKWIPTGWVDIDDLEGFTSELRNLQETALASTSDHA